MLNVELLAERVARTNLQKRRDKEAKRRERIFNDKMRTIGVDKEALDVLVEEKNKQDEAAKEEQKSYDADMLRNNKAACLLQSRQVKAKRAMEKDTVNYRHLYQQPCCRREYDLNDPERCKETEQGEAQMPPGLLGEDPHSRSRQQRQREQLREWLSQQQMEQAEETHQQHLENQRDNQSSVDMDNKVMQLHHMEMKRRKAAAVATKEYNLAMIEERRRQEEYYQQPGGVDAKPFPGRVGVPGLCPSKDRKAPPESLQQILQFQKYQIEERKRVELEKKKEDEQHNRVRLNSARAALLMERQQARLNKQQRQHQDSTNIKMAESHRQQKVDIERGSIDDSFFSKFNTSSR